MNNTNSVKQEYRKTMSHKYLNSSTAPAPAPNVANAIFNVKPLPMVDFLKLGPIYCQRNTLSRLARQSKVFASALNLQSLLNVHIVRYMKDTPYHKKGDEVIGDGNTRQEYWLAEMALGHPVPPFVIAQYYEVWSDDEARALYNTWDNPGASMSATDRIYSAYREVGLHDKLSEKTKIGKASGLSKAFQYAALGRPSYPRYSSTVQNFTPIVKDFEEELVLLDRLLLKNKGKLNEGHVLCSAMILLKKHKGDPKTLSRLLEGFDRLAKQEYGAGSKTSGYDGMTYLMQQLDRAGSKNSQDLFPNGLGTDHINYPLQQEAILFCFNRWLEDKPIRRNRLPSDPVYDPKKGFWK